MNPQPKPSRIKKSEDEKKKSWCRRQLCACCGRPPAPKEVDVQWPWWVEAAHNRTAANSGVGIKPSAEHIMPLCATVDGCGCHQQWHNGVDIWMGRDPAEICRQEHERFLESQA